MVVEEGDLVALAAALGWAATTVLARHISRVIPAIWYNALRIGIASLAMLAVAPWTLADLDLTRVSANAMWLLVVSVLVGFAIGDTAFFESMRRIGVARAAPVAGSHPLVVAVLAVAFLSEPITPMLIVGVMVIGVGVWLITTDQAALSRAPGSGRALLIGVILALVAAVGWAASTVMVRPVLEEIDPIAASTLRMPIATVVLAIAAWRLRHLDPRRLEITPRTAAWLLLAGLMTVLSATLFLWSVEIAGAARTAALSSVSPIFSATMAVLLLGERMTLRLALGMAVSLLGVLGIVVVR
jgi:drug/metabolite transporter (DMT)-like permease